MKRTGKIILNDAIKTFKDDQDKVLSPIQTLDKFKPKLQTFGLDILSDTVRIDNGRLDIPVFFSSCGAGAREIIGTKKQMGKGATPEQAEASAIMELAERYSFFSFYKNSNNVSFDIYNNLLNDALPFELIAQSVHDDSDDLEIVKKIFGNLPLNWTGAYNLTTEKEMLIPLNWFYAINAFNGPSAGNCLEEAICQGICEVLERHVSSVISIGKIPTRLIDLGSVKDLLVIEMLKKYSNSGIQLFITNFTLEFGIPSIGILAYDPNTFPLKSEIIWTSGTATNPEKALSRALTEVAQLAGDFNTCSNYVASGLPKFSSLDEANFVVDKRKSISIMELPDISNDNVKIEVERCVFNLNKLGMNTLIVDTTHPILKIPSTYTIVPGAYFRERAAKTSVAMFLAKITFESFVANESIKRLKEMDRLLPGKYFIQFYIGKCYLKLNQYDLSLSSFFKSIELDPDKEDIPSIYSSIAICYKDLGKYEEALNFLIKGEQFDADRTDIHNLKGFCYFMLKKYKEAIISFKRVIELDPSSAIDYANIASNYRDMGKKNQAIRYYKIALTIDPKIDFAVKNLDILMSE